MNFFKRLMAAVYCVMMVIVGAAVILISTGLVSSGVVKELVQQIQLSSHANITGGVVGLIFVILGIRAPLRVKRSLGSNRLITFKNPDGEVTVAISAIENFVKRVARDVPGIRDIRSAVRVSRKGIKITSHVSIFEGTNIPEVTENIQMTVKARVRDILGIDENINMTMHVSSICNDPEVAPAEDGEEKISDPPFRGLDQ